MSLNRHFSVWWWRGCPILWAAQDNSGPAESAAVTCEVSTLVHHLRLAPSCAPLGNLHGVSRLFVRQRSAHPSPRSTTGWRHQGARESACRWQLLDRTPPGMTRERVDVAGALTFSPAHRGEGRRSLLETWPRRGDRSWSGPVCWCVALSFFIVPWKLYH